MPDHRGGNGADDSKMVYQLLKTFTKTGRHKTSPYCCAKESGKVKNDPKNGHDPVTSHTPSKEMKQLTVSQTAKWLAKVTEWTSLSMQDLLTTAQDGLTGECFRQLHLHPSSFSPTTTNTGGPASPSVVCHLSLVKR